MNHQTSYVPQIAYQSSQVTTQPMTELPLVDSGFVVPVFSPEDDTITCLNKARAFLTAVASSRGDKVKVILVLVIRVMLQVMGKQCNWTSKAWYKDKAMLAEAQEAGRILDEEQLAFLADPGIPDGQAVQTIIPNNVVFQTEDLDTYHSDCDDISNAKAILMANISNYGSDVILEVPHSKTYLNDMENQGVHAMKDFEQTPVVDFTDNEIHKKLALKEQVDSLEQNLSKQIKENECLLQTFMVFKNEYKEKENKYMENEIDLEKKIKELDNIIFKVGQSAQTMHMLTKPRAFYDNIHKRALGYQKPFYLKKAQRIKPTLYDGIVISAKHVVMPMIDDEETLILEEESRSKIKPFVASPVKIEAHKELPKVSLVNESLKKLKFHLARFDNVVKIRTRPDARIEENDRLLQQIMSQDVLLTVMNSKSLIGESMNMDRERKESCDKCFNLEAELLKSQNANNDLLKDSLSL
ncbi:hypothetical protein Tco_0105684 [Tanacetum coccineum]